MLTTVTAVVCGAVLSPVALETTYRPPRQTPTQQSVFNNISQLAAIQSAAAKNWVVNYMSNTTLRGRLPQPYKNLSNEELFERFDWEFRRLPIIHNAPVDDEEVAKQKLVRDDTKLNTTLNNGYIQNPCHRLVTGGPEAIQTVNNYVFGFFVKRAGMPPSTYSPNKWTMTMANECLLYNANNLRKTSLGNFVYGGITYVLNPNTLRSRVFVESWDAGLTESMYKQLNISYPGFGTLDNWYHLVQPHEEFFNLPYPPSWNVPSFEKCCNYSLADLMNRWWVPGTPVPMSGMLMSNPYYEIMTIGNVLLPEDLAYTMLKFSNFTTSYAPDKDIGLWGTVLGRETQEKMKAFGRPVIWANEQNTQMIIDPVVDSLTNSKITPSDVTNFLKYWKPHPGVLLWEQLVQHTPPYMILHFQSYDTRHICADIEADPLNNILGVDGEGNCVYWTTPPSSTGWECMNDGTCEQATTPNNKLAIYSSRQECETQCAHGKWSCVVDIRNSSDPSAKYCVPNTNGTYPDVGSCEDSCYVSS